jgi:hypothetical protein
MSATQKEQHMTIRLMITTALVLAAAYGPALAGDRSTSKRAHHTLKMQLAPGGFSGDFSGDLSGGFSGAPALVRGGLSGYPTDYLTNRFGDRQLQGR